MRAVSRAGKVIHAGGRCGGLYARQWGRPCRYPFHYWIAAPRAASLPSGRPAWARRHSGRPDSDSRMQRLPAPEWLPERRRGLLPPSTAIVLIEFIVFLHIVDAGIRRTRKRGHAL